MCQNKHVSGSADAPNTRSPVSLVSRGQNAGILEKVMEGPNRRAEPGGVSQGYIFRQHLP